MLNRCKQLKDNFIIEMIPDNFPMILLVYFSLSITLIHITVNVMLLHDEFNCLKHSAQSIHITDASTSISLYISRYQ